MIWKNAYIKEKTYTDYTFYFTHVKNKYQKETDFNIRNVNIYLFENDSKGP